jgi:hypothetical protein
MAEREHSKRLCEDKMPKKKTKKPKAKKTEKSAPVMPMVPVVPVVPVVSDVPAEIPAPPTPVPAVATNDGWETKSVKEQLAIFNAIMAGIKNEVEFFHDAEKTPWARVLIGGQTGHYEHLPVQSKDFKWLVEKYAHDHLENGIPKPSWIGHTIDRYVAVARYGEGGTPAQQHTMQLRVAGNKDAIYLDLGDVNWQVVKITAEGWAVIPNSEAPVRFWRPQGMLALPVPQPISALVKEAAGWFEPVFGPDYAVTPERLVLHGLERFVNVAPEDRILVMAWLVAALRPRGPYTILAFHGQQGSAKSSSQRFLKSLVDPTIAPLRSAPRNEHDLMIAAKSSYMLGFDNFSKIDGDLSDALCRLATRGGYSTRKLRTDDTQMLFDFVRPIMFNGITEVAERSDLRERMLLINCPRVREDERRTEHQLDKGFAAQYPYFLGALCSVVAKTMAVFSENDYTDERMQDFTQWAIAAETALGYQPGDFLKAYRANQHELNEQTLEEPVLSRLFEFRGYTPERRDWTGTMAELHRWLWPVRQAGMPNTPEALQKALKRGEDAMRSRGVFITKLPRDGRLGRRYRIWDAEGAALLAEDMNKKAKAKADAADPEKRMALVRAYRATHPEFLGSNQEAYAWALKERDLKRADTTVTTDTTAKGADAAGD